MSTCTVVAGFTAARDCPHCRRTHFSRSKVSPEGAERAAALSVRKCIYGRLMKIVLDGLHRDYWQNNNPEVVGENVCYSYCLKNPDTGGRSPKHKRAGAIGKIVRLFDGRVAVMESRTVEPWCDISPDADYWKRLQVSDEISDLVLAAHEAGYLVDSVLLDVTCTPGLRPGKATPEHQRKYTADGRLFANMRVDDESPEDYAARVYEAVVADPGRYFRREEIVRLPADLLEHQRRLWATRCGL